MLVLFDFDGTLVDSRRCILAAMGRAFADQGLAPPDDGAVLRTVGLQPEDMLQVLCPTQAPVTNHAIAARYRAHAVALRAQDPDLERPFEGAGEILATLRAQGHGLGVVTGKMARGLGQCLSHFGWNDLFDTLQPADGAPGKPDPTLILRAMAAMGATPAETVMIGDTSFDMIMARRAGVRAIGVGWGYHDTSALVQAGADGIVESFAKLRAEI